MRPAARLPKACESAMRCGMAVMGTSTPRGTPIAEPISRATAMRMYPSLVMSGQKSVATIAMPKPISPARTPRRAVEDDEAADQVDRRGDHGDEAEHLRVGRVALAQDHDRHDQRDRREGVREGHERRVQELRDPADHLEAHERREREDEEAGDDCVGAHEATPSSAPRAVSVSYTHLRAHE